MPARSARESTVATGAHTSQAPSAPHITRLNLRGGEVLVLVVGADNLDGHVLPLLPVPGLQHAAERAFAQRVSQRTKKQRRKQWRVRRREWRGVARSGGKSGI